jgi:NTE family protein
MGKRLGEKAEVAVRLRRIVVCCLVAGLAGCDTIPLRNQPLDHYEPDAGYLYRNIAPGDHNSDSLLVVLTFSGGGTRAAALCFGVLEVLRDTPITWEGEQRTLLDEVDVISSVSGGSLTAAYYGLFGDRIFEDFPEKVLYRDIQTNLIKRLFQVQNYSKLASPFYGRTDLMADDFSRLVFDKKDFGDLLARNRRPFLLINATDVSLGTRFDFTQRQFNLLYSDLSVYPVGHAVAASAAFPGLLTPMTLRNYSKDNDYQVPKWVEQELRQPHLGRLFYHEALGAESYIEPGRPYVHLSDGGVSDNLGLLPVIQLLSGSYPSDKSRSILIDGTTKKVLIITVNAKRVETVDWNVEASVLSLFKVLYVATSLPLGNFSDAEIAYMRLYLQQLREKQAVRDRLRETMSPEKVSEAFPELAVPDVDYYFVEVAFDWVEDDEERAYLNAIPTAFELEHEQVDRLRRAARTILDANQEFHQALADLR